MMRRQSCQFIKMSEFLRGAERLFLAVAAQVCIDCASHSSKALSTVAASLIPQLLPKIVVRR